LPLLLLIPLSSFFLSPHLHLLFQDLPTFATQTSKDTRLVNLPYGTIITRAIDGSIERDEIQRQIDSLPSKEELEEDPANRTLSSHPRHASGRKITLSVVGEGGLTVTLECYDFRVVSFVFSDTSSHKSVNKILVKLLDQQKFQSERERFATDLWVGERKSRSLKESNGQGTPTLPSAAKPPKRGKGSIVSSLIERTDFDELNEMITVLSIMKIYERRNKNNGLECSIVNSSYLICPSYPERLTIPTSIKVLDLVSVAPLYEEGEIPIGLFVNPKNSNLLARSSLFDLTEKRTSQDLKTLVRKNLLLLNKYFESTSATPEDASPVGLNFSGVQILCCGTYPENSRKPLIGLQSLGYQIQEIPWLSFDSIMRSYLSLWSFSVRFYQETPSASPIKTRRQATPTFSEFESVLSMKKTPQFESPYSQRPIHRWLTLISKTIQQCNSLVEVFEKPANGLLFQSPSNFPIATVISSFIQLLIDPYYRSFEGFAQLLEKDWCYYGHSFKFPRKSATSSTTSTYPNSCSTSSSTSPFSSSSPPTEQSLGAQSGFPSWAHQHSLPLLFFLDLVFQVIQQFPTSFAFNDRFLRHIFKSVHSCRFSTFLLTTEQNRLAYTKPATTIWSLAINSPRKARFVNPCFVLSTSDHQKLIPTSDQVIFWSTLYLQYSATPKIEESVSKAIGEVTKRFEIRNTRLPFLVDSLWEKIQFVKTLDLSGNYLTKIPLAVTNLENLKRLILANNCIVSISEDFILAAQKKLQSLQELNISGNRLVVVPISFSSLSVRIVKLQTNVIRTPVLLPAPTLYADLSRNPFRRTTVFLPHHQSLESLDLSYTNMSEVPGCLCERESLTSLNISGNPLSKLPEQFSLLQNLNCLYLDETKLTSLTPVFQLRQLRILSAHNCGLMTIDDSISSLFQMRILRLR
jgi:Leucine-rich repeat (LRR) protein